MRFRPNKVNTYVDGEITRITEKLHDLEVTDEKYAKLLDRLNTLHRIRQEEKPDLISADTIALVAANLVGILLILNYEHGAVITSKALGLLVKPRP